MAKSKLIQHYFKVHFFAISFTLLTVSCDDVHLRNAEASKANETIEKDNQYTENYMQQFRNGMSLEDVRNIFLKGNKKVEFYNECIKNFQYPVTTCTNGYNLITTINLPSFYSSLGKGKLQMYFYFNRNQILEENLYEFYYPTQH